MVLYQCFSRFYQVTLPKPLSRNKRIQVFLWTISSCKLSWKGSFPCSSFESDLISIFKFSAETKELFFKLFRTFDNASFSLFKRFFSFFRSCSKEPCKLSLSSITCEFSKANFFRKNNLSKFFQPQQLYNAEKQCNNNSTKDVFICFSEEKGHVIMAVERRF